MTDERRRFALHVCDGPSCGVTHESERLVACLQREIERRPDLRDRVAVNIYTCFGRCEDGPNMFVRQAASADDLYSDPDPEVLETERGFYPGMDEQKIVRVLEHHCGRGEAVEDLVDDY